jgi:hypothetical protein
LNERFAPLSITRALHQEGSIRRIDSAESIARHRAKTPGEPGRRVGVATAALPALAQLRKYAEVIDTTMGPVGRATSDAGKERRQRLSRDQRGKRKGDNDLERSQTCVISPGDESFGDDGDDPSLLMLSLLLQAIGTITTARPRRIQNAKPEIFRMFPLTCSPGSIASGR